MLTGVCADSSAKTKDGWLSDDACREGISKLGVPARLRGLEKLNEGRGKADESDPMDGDLWNEPDPVGIVDTENAALPDESLRFGAKLG